MKPSKLSLNKVWLVAIFLSLIVCARLLSLSTWPSAKRPSILIIAVDRLAFNSFTCGDEKPRQTSGLSVLCQESLRFTHAYTPSTQPAAAMASLLTGLYPYEHQLHRSFDRLSIKANSLAEIAAAKNYRTSFWSGSPSILKKTGLSRGFDLFDDFSFLDKKNYFNTLKSQSEIFLTWVHESREPFLAVLYNSELENISEGESDITNFEKFDEKLAVFFEELKSNQLWEQNYIIVTGLQGTSDYSRIDETAFSNLHTENTNITLFIKPPRQKGDEGVHWKTDSPITLADLGYSFKKILSSEYQTLIDERFPVIDLSRLWLEKGAEEEPLTQRKILIESVNTWSKNLMTRFGIIYKNLLYIEKSETDEIYNTLSDGLETIDISSTATTSQNDFKNDNRQILSEIRVHKKLSRWNNYAPENNDWVQMNREYWSKPNNRSLIFEKELWRYIKERKTQPLTALLIQYLQSQNRLDEIKSLHLNIDGLKTASLEKDLYWDDIRRQSLNLSLENLWGLWIENKNWFQSPFIIEYQ